MTLLVLPGDVLCVRSKHGLAGRLIRLGAALRDQPNRVNHVAVVTHRRGEIWYGIEGRPGGVGWVDVSPYLASPWTISTAAQPKTHLQRLSVVETMTALLGTPYDWLAIAGDGLGALTGRAHRVSELWDEQWDGQMPGHVVCSSAADFANERARLASPKPDRDCTPADWDQFITEAAW